MKKLLLTVCAVASLLAAFGQITEVSSTDITFFSGEKSMRFVAGLTGTYFFPRLADNTDWEYSNEFGFNQNTRYWYFDQGLVIGSRAPKPNYKLSVDGKIVCEELLVQLSTEWADYVFAPTYKLMSLSATESYINKNKHLPNIPSAAEVLAEGISLGQMSKLQMEKIEELTLHMITINKDKENLEKQVETAAQRIARLEAQNTLLLERMAAIEAFLNK